LGDNKELIKLYSALDVKSVRHPQPSNPISSEQQFARSLSLALNHHQRNSQSVPGRFSNAFRCCLFIDAVSASSYAFVLNMLSTITIGSPAAYVSVIECQTMKKEESGER